MIIILHNISRHAMIFPLYNDVTIIGPNIFPNTNPIMIAVTLITRTDLIDILFFKCVNIFFIYMLYYNIGGDLDLFPTKYSIFS